MPAGRITIQLNSGDLENPDLDLRYAIPDELMGEHPGLFVDEGYDYVGPDNTMCIFLGTNDPERAATGVVAWVRTAEVLGNKLARAARVLLTIELTERTLFDGGSNSSTGTT